MNGAGAPPPAALVRATARHSLGWLVAANFVGVWLALVLLWPALGDLVAPLTYGRWVPLHLDWQLYGWTALPVVGVLLAWFVDERDAGGARVAFGAWTVALALGGVSWLAGRTSGKLFLDWTGLARPLLPAAMLVLWGVLGRALWRRWFEWTPRERWARFALLALLAPVPHVLFWSMGREVYPAVNPDSGGATGAALLGSTLGIVTIFLLLPALLHVPARSAQFYVIRKIAWGAWAVSWGVFAVVDHGHATHHALSQIAALGVLLAWVPLLAWFWLAHAWSDAAWPWLRAGIAWWALLVLSGWVDFLPGVSESQKFTHGLVAHAHLAMAGLVTAVNAVMLTTLRGRAAPRGVFALWQAGCVVHLVVLAALGAVEQERAADLFRSEAWTQAVFALRLLGGAAMAAASAWWLKEELSHE